MGQIFDQWRAGKHMLGSDLPVKGMSQLSISDKTAFSLFELQQERALLATLALAVFL